jgi:HK97 family phage prohead protease
VFDTPLGRQTLERVGRGEAKGCSIGFRPRPAGERYTRDTVLVKAADLTEISICFKSKPAWYGTTVQIES